MSSNLSHVLPGASSSRLITSQSGPASPGDTLTAGAAGWKYTATNWPKWNAAASYQSGEGGGKMRQHNECQVISGRERNMFTKKGVRQGQEANMHRWKGETKQRQNVFFHRHSVEAFIITRAY